ncbi:hypothetical protein CPB85DRAFT_1432315 [Mucidula mucida]|nr:hypothetical protein CPB85DRAFT_1432315 [Mucidula mucida]
MNRENAISALDDWISAQKVLLAQTHTDLDNLRRLHQDPLAAPLELSRLPDSPPQITWDWAPFQGCDPTPLFGFPHRPHTTGPRPLSTFVHDAKSAILNPLFEQWNMDWDPPQAPPPRKETAKNVDGVGRSVVTYLTRDAAGETADVDIDDDGDVPMLPIPVASPSPPPPPIADPLPDKSKQKTKQKKRKRASPAPSTVSHATKAPPTSSKPRPETFKQAWSDSEQHLLERLLEEYPDGVKNRWKMISVAMDGRRTARQVASRVQKYFAKLKRFGLE